MSDIKTFPTQGFRYKVVAGDRIKTIAERAYGSKSYASKIVSANTSILSSRPISLEGLPTIYDDILIIPKLRQKVKDVLVGKDPNEVNIVLAGREINVTEATLLLTMNTGSDAWSAVIPWTPGDDKKLDEKLLPFKYPETQVYIGGKLMNNGRLYTVSPSLTKDGSIKTLTGYSLTIDLLDSTVPPPYERNKFTLEQLADAYTLGTDLTPVFTADTGGPFDRVTAGNTESKFSHLAKLSAQRGLLASNTKQGNPLFHLAKTTGKTIGTLSEGDPLVLSWGATYDGRKLFNAYKAIGQSPGGDAQTATAIDKNIPVSRNITFKADETTQGNIGKSAEWQRSRRYADALPLSLSVKGFYAPDGNLWETNTLVAVIAPSLDLSDGFVFLIEQTEFRFSSSGFTTNLKLVPPQVYSREAVGYPWSIS